MILNVRGTHGSGKTTISQTLLDEHPHEEIKSPNFRTDNPSKPIAFDLNGLVLVGRRQAGADGIRHQPLMLLVQEFAKRGHVMFENVLVSANAGAWLNFRRTLPEQDWCWATLDTPVDLCVERVGKRRAAAKEAGFHHRQENINERLLREYHARCWRSKELLEERGETNSLWIDHTRAYDQVHELLRSAGWACGH